MSQTREQLSDDAIFHHYRLELTPNFETFKYKGRVTVDLEVVKPTRLIELNSHELSVESAVLKDLTANETCNLEISYDFERQRVLFGSSSEVQPGRYSLTVSFQGEHNDKMVGFYRSRYTDTKGETRYLVTTQFEATDARRCFPCADEPSRKATFDIILHVPKELTALSNMPVKSSLPSDTSDGCSEKVSTLKTVQFETTPIMSTYLLAFYVGEAEYVEETITLPSKRQVVVRVYTPKKRSEEGRFALDLAAKVLLFFSLYFDIEYPLPKMDLIAIPDFAAGAMENWGLVTFRSRLLLYQEGETSFKTKVRIAYVVCHELAHQWFGNLVTMEWWSDLWLNEGFATWVGWMATDHFYPEWKVWEMFNDEEYARALELDRLSSSHPISNKVTRATEVGEIFDAITYSKGASVIRMLVNALGETVFQTGLRSYLKKYAYSNAKTADLWNSLSEASGEDVVAMMSSWTDQVGFPLVQVKHSGDGQVYIRQRKFVPKSQVEANGGVDSDGEMGAPKWVVPLNVLVHNLDGVTDIVRRQLEERETKLDMEVWKLNANSTGFYLTLYDEVGLDRLALAIRDRSILPPIDRAEIINTLALCGLYGYVSAQDVVEFARNYYGETEYCVVESVVASLSIVRDVWYDYPSIVEKVNCVLTALLKQLYDNLGWTKDENETPQTTQLRVLAINALGNLGHAEVLDVAGELFSRFINGDQTAISPDLRAEVFSMLVRHDPTSLKKMLTLYDHSNSEEVRSAVLGAIGRVDNNEQLVEVLNFAYKSGQVRSQDAFRVSTVAAGGRLREENWRYLVENWSELCRLYQGGSFLFGRIVGASVGSLYREGVFQQAKEFLDSHQSDLAEINNTVKQAIEKAVVAQEWRKNDSSLLV